MNAFYKVLSIAAATALTFVACTKEIEAPIENSSLTGITSFKFKANTENLGTKATLAPENDGETSFAAAWENGDEMVIESLSLDPTFDEFGTAVWDSSEEVFNATYDESVTLPAASGDWTYSAWYPAKANVPFQSNRVQNGNAYASEYDLMYGSIEVDGAQIGKNADGTSLVIPMNRLTAIAYYHITSGLNEDVVSATLTVDEGKTIAAETVEISGDGKTITPTNGSNTVTITFADGTAPKATDFQLWFNILTEKIGTASSYNVTVDIVTTGHTAKLTSKSARSFTAGKLNRAKISSLNWKESRADAVFFEERFSESTGTMGWSGQAANGTFDADNEGWATANEYGAGGSARFGTGTKLGSAETPSITIGNDYIGEDVLLSFKAGAWSSSSENTNLKISATGAKIFNDSNVETGSVAMNKGEWTTYTLHLKNITSSVKIKFEGNSSSNSRFFLDDVVVYYGTKPAVSSLSVSPSEDQEVTHKAGTKDYAVTYTVDGVSSTDWSVSTSSEGFSVAKNANGTGFTVSYSQNNGAERTGVIVVTGGSRSQTVKIIQGEKSLTDELTAVKIGVSSYSNWNNITDLTGVVYAGNSTKTTSDEIQLRSTTPSGIVSTTTIGFIKKIVVDWGPSLTTGRTLDIYGSNVAYESSADLYNSTKRGIKIGSLSFTSDSNNETELTVSGDYAYVGVRSNDGALYLKFIKFTYEEDNREDPGMSWNPTEATATITNSGTTFTTPTLNLGNASSVTYNSTEPSVATVESDGTVNILAAGTTKIQAIFAGDATYKPSTKEYTLNVTDERTYAITVTQPAEGGTISASPNGSQAAGTGITLAANASDGYKFSAWDVYKTGDPSTKVTFTGNTFEMPAYPVTVTAAFDVDEGTPSAQTLFLETFGDNGSSNTAVDSYSGYTATQTMFSDPSSSVVSHYSSVGKVGKNSVNPSQGYDSVSGLSAVWTQATKNTTTNLFTVDKIDISNATDITVSFGLFYLNGAIGSSSTVKAYYTIDNNSEVELSFTQPSATNSWTLCSGTISGTGSVLKIRFELTVTGGYTVRIDDIKVAGTK